MTKIKICGITNAEDAWFCDESGADFLGFVFVRESPRYVEPETVRRIRTRAKRVGVFRDAALEEIARVAKIADLDLVQLHGSESEDLVRKIELPVIKAFRVDRSMPDTRSSAEWLMFDSGGGTGRTFDWSLLANLPRTRPFFLAGGIRAGNVRRAIDTVRPDAIDVASGVESRPGVKDYVNVKLLIEEVRR
jgi:phosphoribosylanthranilate isomerase